MDLNKISQQPIFFNQNRVYRNYTGAAGFNSLCGCENSDCFFPEEWIASSVKAINPVYFGERDGVSVIEGTHVFFDDFLKSYKSNLLGDRKYDCLVKYLDSAIRLPVQVHPTKDFSSKYFNSPYGKTEAWLVLAVRDENAKLYFGFKDKIDLDTLKAYSERSLTEHDALTEIITPVKAEAGDVYLIRAGLIHAIGAGCTILEIQEPTDFTIQIEDWCGDSRVSEDEKYLGLQKDIALSCFDFKRFGPAALKSAKVMPTVVSCCNGIKKETLISHSDTPCFAENRYTLTDGELTMGYGPSVWAVIDGAGDICGVDYSRKINKGDYFFLPFAAEGKFGLKGKLTVIECLPSLQK